MQVNTCVLFAFLFFAYFMNTDRLKKKHKQTHLYSLKKKKNVLTLQHTGNQVFNCNQRISEFVYP